jgi:NAD/NADP transhydrogenase beta subunit
MNLSAELVNFVYIISAALFILGLKMLGHPDSARKGNLYSAVGYGACDHRDAPRGQHRLL